MCFYPSLVRDIDWWFVSGLFFDVFFFVVVQVFPAATDSRFLRALGVRALGFSPMRQTEILLHEIDEYIPENTYVEGISVYVWLLKALASQGKNIDHTTTASSLNGH